MINRTQETVVETEMVDGEPVYNNVIVFPRPSKNRPPQSIEEIYRSVELAKTTRIEEVTEAAIINMFEDLFDSGFDFTERTDTNKDMAFLIEAVKSLLCKHDGMGHSFQNLAEEHFTADANGDLTFNEPGCSSDTIDTGEVGC